MTFRQKGGHKLWSEFFDRFPSNVSTCLSTVFSMAVINSNHKKVPTDVFYKGYCVRVCLRDQCTRTKHAFKAFSRAPF